MSRLASLTETWNKPECLTETLDIGWITPKGFFYGIEEGRHNKFLFDNLKISRNENVQNWVLVGSCECKKRTASWMYFDSLCGGEENLTEPQKKTLERMGYDASNPYAKRNQAIEFLDVFPESYQNHPHVETLDT